MSFELPALPYAYEALQPYMSRETLEFHHDKHHRGYVDATNKLAQVVGLQERSLEEIIKIAHRSTGQGALYNNAAQHWNHAEFWFSIKPNGAGTIPSEIDRLIAATFGNIDAFKQEFVSEGLAQFGSGWVWLVLADGKLEILKTSNADNPIVFGKTALITCDVWEHAYYIDYRNRRADFLKAFVDHLIDWERVAERYTESERKTAA